jgi:methylmalonyl-CoA/ethylmalonyl-CoA epimerase
MDNSDLFVCIDHVGLAVPNLDEAIKFHIDVMGWRLLHREKNEEQGVEEAMLGTGTQGAENAQIQLLAPLSENSAVGKFIAKNGGRGGIQHIAYRVADMDAVDATLRERGVALLYPAPKVGTGGARINFVHPKSSGGVLLELTQPPADAHH